MIRKTVILTEVKLVPLEEVETRGGIKDKVLVEQIRTEPDLYSVTRFLGTKEGHPSP